MATALSALIQSLSEEIGDYEYLLASANGTTTTIIDASLANLPGGGDDDAFEGWYIKITEAAHAAIGEVRRLSSTTFSDNTLTWLEATSGALLSGEAYELHRIDPRLKALSINQALERLIDDLYLPIRDETLVVDQRLLNGDFENGTFTSWTTVGAPTVTADTATVFHGTSSAKIIAAGADGQLTQIVSSNVHEITGKQVTFRAWAFATAVNAVRIRLDWGGGAFENSVFHSGKDQFEQLKATASVPSTATQVKAIVEVADGNTGFFDAAYLYHTPIHRYTLPTALVYSHITQQGDENLPDGPYFPFGRGDIPTPGRILRVEGKNILSSMSTDTATTELNAPQTRLLVVYALGLLFRMLAAPTRAAGQQVERYQAESDRWFNEYETMRRRRGMTMKLLGHTNMEGTAHIERDGVSNYLVFDRLGRTAGPLQGSVSL